MKDLKHLETKAFNLHQAVARFNELIEREKKSDAGLLEMIRSMIAEISIEAEYGFPEVIRIAPEQVDADTLLLNKLEESVNAWSVEMELVQKDLIEQAILDAKAGEKSNRYLVLEKRETDLKKLIAEADEKLGKVTGRMMSPGFGNAVQKIVNDAKSQ